MKPKGFFGYGSLVNQATHAHQVSGPATLKGWARNWQQSDRRDVAFLTAHPDADSEIDGLVAMVEEAGWPALDQREFSYSRVHLPPENLQPRPISGLIIYQAHPKYSLPGPARKPILMSYLDCVVQGFLDQFGDQGVTRFFQSTKGWGTPLLNDRQAPRYSRAIQASGHCLNRIDNFLQEQNAEILSVAQTASTASAAKKPGPL